MRAEKLRKYSGPVKLVVFDLAGTVLDYGSRAPAEAFVELFKRHGVSISVEQARGPMGMDKKDHIRALAKTPDVAERWRAANFRDCSENDIDRLYNEFIPLQLECLPKHNKLIPGALESAEWLKERGVVVAVTTGYNREMMELTLEAAALQGFKPDAAFCASDLAGGRPAPWMIFRCMEQTGVYPVDSVVKIGDTIVDIEDGVNAGVWSVGVTSTGNMLGLKEDEIEKLSYDALLEKTEHAAEAMRAAGADYVIDGVHLVPVLVEEIEAAIREGFAR